MLRTRNWISAWLGAISLLAAACAHDSAVLAPHAAPVAGQAIVFGRFSTRRVSTFDNQLALWLQNVDTRNDVYIFFDPRQPVQALEIKPGRYRIAGIAGANRVHAIVGCRDLAAEGKPAAFLRPFDVAGNTGVYLGDFTGHTSFEGVRYVWKMDSVTNNFATTAREFRQDYPKLDAMPLTSVGELQAGANAK